MSPMTRGSITLCFFFVFFRLPACLFMCLLRCQINLHSLSLVLSPMTSNLLKLLLFFLLQYISQRIITIFIRQNISVEEKNTLKLSEESGWLWLFTTSPFQCSTEITCFDNFVHWSSCSSVYLFLFSVDHLFNHRCSRFRWLSAPAGWTSSRASTFPCCCLWGRRSEDYSLFTKDPCVWESCWEILHLDRKAMKW